MNNTITYLQSLRTDNAFFNASFLLMALAMLLLPFTTWFMWPIGVLLMTLWVCQWNWREKWENFKTNDGIPYGFFLLGICLIPLLGFINSENMPAAWSTLEAYIWFFFAPLIFLTTSTKNWKRKHFDVLLSLFVIGAAADLVCLFLFGIYRTAKTGDLNFMFSDKFCFNNHHTYTALYFTFAYLLIFERLLNRQHEMTKKHAIGLYLLGFLFAIGVLCVYSRAGILIILFMHTLWCLYAVYRKRSRWKYLLPLTLLVFGLFTIMIETSPVNRFAAYSIHYNHNSDDKQTDRRWFIWKAAWDGVVESMPWGVGTGDGNDVVTENYYKSGHYDEVNCNAHNQFLFVLLTNGILGLVITLLYFITPLCTGIKHRDLMLVSLFLLLFSNCLFECMFERRAGAYFFAVIIPLLIMRANVHTLGDTLKQ